VTSALKMKFPPAVNLEWQDRAACSGMGYELFYGTMDGGSEYKAASDQDISKAEAERIAAARAICRDCPVQPQCLRHALNYPEPFGIWGGLTSMQRTHLRIRVSRVLRERRRGRQPEAAGDEGQGHGEGNQQS
jgi:WhiB family transcriptional regulator, redox-sensing transcriptional regulator